MEGTIGEHLANTLPVSFLGYPTNFSEPDPGDHGVQHLEEVAGGPVRHKVEITDLGGFLEGYLGVRDWRTLDVQDWLTLPEQKLRSLAAGEVFHDGLPAVAPGTVGALTELRRALAYYPRDVWLFQMAAAWQRIGQEEHLMGRAGIVGNEVGSALIAARIVRDVMRLCFLMERTYAPYPKWFGTAFRRLRSASALYPVLQQVLGAPDWRSRQSLLVTAYEEAARMHNRLGITVRMPENARQFYGRPFSVIALHGFAEALLDRMDPRVLTGTMRRSPIGGID